MHGVCNPKEFSNQPGPTGLKLSEKKILLGQAMEQNNISF